MVPKSYTCFELREKLPKYLKILLFSDVISIMVNSKILIVSGTPIRMIFQNSVTYVTQLPSLHII